jgi:hypothetical protein
MLTKPFILTTISLLAFSPLARGIRITAVRSVSNSGTLTTRTMNTRDGMQSSSQATHNFVDAAIPERKNNYLPTIIVFDLDDCLWSPEMHMRYK